jgi:hypothetical protein
MHRKGLTGSADFSARLETAGEMERVYRRYVRPLQLERRTVGDLKTFEKLVLKKGHVLGLNEISSLRQRYASLRRGDLPPIQGEKHPLLVLQDVKVLSPRVKPRLKRTQTHAKWHGPSHFTSTRSSSLQWTENLQVHSI